MPPSRTCRRRSTRRRTSAAHAAGAADLQQGQSGRHADPHAGGELAHVVAGAGRRLRRLGARAEDRAGQGRRPGGDRRRPEAGGARQGRSRGARRCRPHRRGRAQRAVAANVNQPKGNLDGPRQDWAIATNDQLDNAASFRPLIIANRNGVAVRSRRSRKSIDGVENAAARPAAPDDRAGDHPRRPAPARREHHRRRRSHQAAAAAAQGVDAAGHRRHDPADRTETVRASVHDVQFTLI